MWIATALASTVAFATGAVATVILGGGPAKTDRYVVLDIAGTSGLTTASTLECVDGESGCDLDGPCNDQCQFGVRACVSSSRVFRAARPPTRSTRSRCTSVYHP